MSKEFEIIAEKFADQEKGYEILERLVEAGAAPAVFSEPVTNGEYTVITASESRVALGYGYGGGGGVDPDGHDDPDSATAGLGGGGGGGGATMARPVAIIEIGPDGARVEPIVDPTKIALAFITMLLSVFTMGAKMRRAMKG